MSRAERREQLIRIGLATFAQRGYDATSIEEIAAQADVSKPVIYEHFGGKEGLYQVIVDRETTSFMDTVAKAMPAATSPRKALIHTIVGVLDYMEHNTDGYRLLMHQSPDGISSGVFAPVLGEVTENLTVLLSLHLERHGLNPPAAPVYGQMLGGAMVHVGMWWIREGAENSGLSREEFSAHVINLFWNGLHDLQKNPRLDDMTETR